MARRLEVTAQTLAGIDAFKALDATQRALVALRCNGRVYQAGEIVVDAGVAGTDVYFIVTGSVTVTQAGASGKQTPFSIQRAGEMFGELAAIDGEPRSAEIVCVGETALVWLTRPAWQAVLDEFPSVGAFVMQHLVGMVRRLSTRVHEFTTLSVRQRLHLALLRIAERGEQATLDAAGIPLALPKQELLAGLISTHREAVTKELSALRKDGILGKQGPQLVVLNIRRLRKLVESS